MNRSDMVALKAKEIKKEVQRELEGRLDIDDEEVLKIRNAKTGCAAGAYRGSGNNGDHG